MPSESDDSSIDVQAPAHAATARPPSLADRLKQLIGLRASPSSIRDDLEDALTEGEGAREFSPEERAMLKNILGLREMRVDDVMVPRADIVAVASDISLADLLRVFEAAEHSRLPVYEETLDDPRGIVHIKDLLRYITTQALVADRPAGETPVFELGRVDLSPLLSSVKLLRPVLFVPPSMPAIDLLAKMQAARVHMALVIDEYGGTDGLVTIEDLVEMVVGDIEDEYDEDEGPAIQRTEDGAYVADARVSLEDATALVGEELVAPDLADDVDTLGGLLVTLAGRVPVRGEVIAGDGAFEFEVLDADPRRLKKVKIQRKPEAGELEAADAAPAAVAAPDAQTAARS